MKDRKNQGGTAGRNLWEMDIFPARISAPSPACIKRILPNPTVYRHFFTMDFDCALLADFGKQAFLLANRSTCTANRCTKNHVVTTHAFSHLKNGRSFPTPRQSRHLSGRRQNRKTPCSSPSHFQQVQESIDTIAGMLFRNIGLYMASGSHPSYKPPRVEWPFTSVVVVLTRLTPSPLFFW